MPVYKVSTNIFSTLLSYYETTVVASVGHMFDHMTVLPN